MDNYIGIFGAAENVADRLKDTFNKNGLVERKNVLVSSESGYTVQEGTTLLLCGDIYHVEGNKDEKAAYILKAFFDDGIRSFKKLDGEFTLIISSEKETVVFRDRHGAGPQVYYNDMFFTSYLKNLLNVNEFSAKPNKEALFTFLSIGYIPAPMSSLDGVSKLPGGYVLRVEGKNQKIEALYPWEEFKESSLTQTGLSIEEATAKYEELHKSSLKARIDGKKSVGLLLSGGYDSGGNIAGLREVYSGDAYSYSIGFKDNPWTELPLAKILSERFGTSHTEYEIDGTEIRNLPEIVTHLGDPFQEGGLMVNYTAMKLVGDSKPEVILGGDGNDQHFGTAGKELALNWDFRKKGLSGFQKMYSSLGAMEMFNKDNILFRTQFHNDKILNIQKSDNFGFKSHDIKRLSKDKISLKQHKYLADVPTSFSSFDEFYYVHNYFGDIKQVVNEVILFKASKMASLFNNSLSFPYMSSEIYDFLQTLPRSYKCKGTVKELSKGKGVTKYLHKSYLKPKLPTEITDRKKQGGFAPLPIFFKDERQRKILGDYILQSDAAKELFSITYLEKFIKTYDENAKGGGYWFWYTQVKAFQFFNLLVVAVWWDVFINNKQPKLF